MKNNTVGELKRCSKCKTEKPFELFYKNKAMRDGYCNYCISCLKKRYVSKRDTPYHERQLSLKRGRYQERKAKGDYDNLYQRKKLKSPERVKARNALSYAIASGKLIKQPCTVCGDTKVQAHHTDYSKPLDVTWLCIKHHMQQHRTLTI